MIDMICRSLGETNGTFAVFAILIVAVLMIVAWCFIFSKAYIAPAKFLIPFYGQYLAYSLADSGELFLINIGINVLESVFGFLVSGNALRVIALISLVILFAINVVFSLRLARVFSKGVGFSLGLIFLNPVFLCILAFGRAEYKGFFSEGDTIGNAPVRWECPACGAKNSPFADKCEKCGTSRPVDKVITYEDVEATGWACRFCGEKNPLGADVCQKCGNRRL